MMKDDLTPLFPGILTPYYDPDTSMVYMAGKGDGNVRYYQLLNEAPWVYYLNEFITGAPQKGALMHQLVRCLDCISYSPLRML